MTRRMMFGLGAGAPAAILVGATAVAFTGHGPRHWHGHAGMGYPIMRQLWRAPPAACSPASTCWTP